MPFIQGQTYAQEILKIQDENPGIHMAHEHDGKFTVMPSTSKPALKQLAMVNGELREVTDENLETFELGLKNANDYVVNFQKHWSDLTLEQQAEFGGEPYQAYKKAVEAYLEMCNIHAQLKNRKKFIVI